MHLQFIRHAASILEFQNKRILIDPMLSEAGSLPPIAFTANRMRNPLVPLPVNALDLIRKADAVLVTHAHFDHFDREAIRLIPKNKLIFCQPGDEKKLSKNGFEQVKTIENYLDWGTIHFKRCPAKHARGFQLNKIMGKSSSYLIRSGGVSIFITGDAVLDDLLEAALSDSIPDIVIANAGAAQMLFGKPITLTAGEIKKIRNILPEAKIIAVHMNAINHCGLSGNGLKEYLEKEGLNKNITIPKEGDVIPL